MRKSAIDKAIEQLDADLALAKFDRDQAEARYQAKAEATAAAIHALQKQQRPRSAKVASIAQVG